MTLLSILIGPVTNLVLVIVLVIYRVKKKFKREAFKGVFGWLDQNIVEVIIGGMLLPGVVNLIVKVVIGK